VAPLQDDLKRFVVSVVAGEAGSHQIIPFSGGNIVTPEEGAYDEARQLSDTRGA